MGLQSILQYIYVIYRLGRAVLEKYFPEALEAARDRRSRAASEAEGKYFSSTARPKR